MYHYGAIFRNLFIFPHCMVREFVLLIEMKCYMILGDNVTGDNSLTLVQLNCTLYNMLLKV